MHTYTYTHSLTYSQTHTNIHTHTSCYIESTFVDLFIVFIVYTLCILESLGRIRLACPGSIYATLSIYACIWCLDLPWIWWMTGQPLDQSHLLYLHTHIYVYTLDLVPIWVLDPGYAPCHMSLLATFDPSLLVDMT